MTTWIEKVVSNLAREHSTGQEFEAHFGGLLAGLFCFGRTEAEAVANATAWVAASGRQAMTCVAGEFDHRENCHV